MIKDNRNNEQIYGRNDMIMLEPNNKIYGSLGIADNYVMKTEEGTMLVLRNPKSGRFGDALTEFNIYGRSEQKQYSGKNLAHGKNEKYYINTSVNLCGFNNNDIGMAIDVSNLTNVTISTRSIQDRYRIGCVDTVPTDKKTVTCYNGKNKDGTKDSYTIDTTGHNYLIVNATKLEDIQVEKGSEATSYEPYTGGIPSPSPNYPQEIKSVVNPTVKVTNEDGLKVQSVTLNNITLNAIQVSSGGNVTIDGKKWICDEVDLQRGVRVQRIKVKELNPGDKWSYRKLASGNNNFQLCIYNADVAKDSVRSICNILPFKNVKWDDSIQNLPKIYASNKEITVSFPLNSEYSSLEAFKQLLTNVKSVIYYALATPIETPLTPAEIAAFNALTTYYPVTIVENNHNTWMKATYKSIESV